MKYRGERDNDLNCASLADEDGLLNKHPVGPRLISTKHPSFKAFCHLSLFIHPTKPRVTFGLAKVFASPVRRRLGGILTELQKVTFQTSFRGTKINKYSQSTLLFHILKEPVQASTKSYNGSRCINCKERLRFNARQKRPTETYESDDGFVTNNGSHTVRMPDPDW